MKSKIDRFVIDSLNKMFEISGSTTTYEDIKDREDDWFMQETITEAQVEEFKEWFVSTIRSRRIVTSKKTALDEWIGFWLMWGLKEEK